MRRRPTLLLTAAAASLALAGCGSGTPEASEAGERIAVVASTSVYADIARAVGGDAVDVKAVIDKTSQDPHSYEATAQDKLAVSKADLVLANGGGYDSFIDVLAEDLDLGPEVLLHAVDHSEAAHAEQPAASGAAAADAGPSEEVVEGQAEEGDHEGHDHGGANEHVWYDVHTMEALAGAVAAKLGAIAPESAAEFTANAERFAEGLAPVEEKTAELAAAPADRHFAMTEPVPYYLLVEAGLEDGTPEGFSAAVETGDDVPPLLLKELQDGLAAGEYAVLAYNPQTAGPQTEAIRQAAERSGVPVVEFTETLPEGEDYVSWMTANIEALETALAG